MTASASRHRRVRGVLLAGVCAAGLGVAVPARAAEITADAAQGLERQLHDWLSTLLGPQVKLGDLPLHMTAEADHYRLELPFAAPLAAAGITVEGDPFSAKLTPLEGGRWALDDIRAPSPMRLSFAAPGDAGGSNFSATIEQQDQHAVLDPSFATPSRWDGTIKGYSSTTGGNKETGSSTMRVEEMTLHMAIDPLPDGRVNVVQESESRLIASNATVPQVGLASFSVGRMLGSIKLNGVAPDRIAPLVHAAMTLAPLGAAAAAAQAGAGTSPAAAAPMDRAAIHAMAEENRKAMEADKHAAEADRAAVAAGKMTPADRKKNAEQRHARAQARMEALKAARAHPPAAPAAPAPPSSAALDFTPEQRAAAHDALVALADLMDGFDEQQTFEDVHVVAGGFSGHLGKLVSGLSVGAPEGRTALRINFVLDGLDSPDVPPGIFRDYMPRHIAVSPRVGGLPAADLRALLLRAADSAGNDPELQAQAQALLQKGPVVAGIDELSLDFGPATLKGTGEVRVSGLDTYEGEAHLTATGLDALIKQANTVPELKQAGPVLFLVKGMGRQTGTTTVWDITYRDGQVLVNGNDLAAMMGK